MLMLFSSPIEHMASPGRFAESLSRISKCVCLNRTSLILVRNINFRYLFNNKDRETEREREREREREGERGRERKR